MTTFSERKVGGSHTHATQSTGTNPGQIDSHAVVGGAVGRRRSYDSKKLGHWAGAYLPCGKVRCWSGRLLRWMGRQQWYKAFFDFVCMGHTVVSRKKYIATLTFNNQVSATITTANRHRIAHYTGRWPCNKKTTAVKTFSSADMEFRPASTRKQLPLHTGSREHDNISATLQHHALPSRSFDTRIRQTNRRILLTDYHILRLWTVDAASSKETA